MIAWYHEHNHYMDASKVERGAYYRSDTKYIAKLVGNEVPPEFRDFGQALRYTNCASQLGLDEKECKILDYMLSALGEGTRFATHPAIQIHHGENAATHSMQSIALMERILHTTIVNSDDINEAMESAMPLRQAAGIALLLHDMGEICGEAGFATGGGAVFEEGFSKTEMEHMLLKAIMGFAIAFVEQGSDKEDFLKLVRSIRQQLDIEGKAATGGLITSEEVADTLTNHHTHVPLLSENGRQILHQFMALWHMAEFAGKETINPYILYDNIILPDNHDFIGLLVKSVEHVQGTRHLLRFARKDPLVEHTDMKEFSGVLAYAEGEIADLFRMANGKDFHYELARTQRNQTYGTLMQYADTVLDTHYRTDSLYQTTHPSWQNMEAKRHLTLLENLIGAYENAIHIDRIPPEGERSYGAMVLPLLQQKLEQDTPNHHISEARYLLKSLVAEQPMAMVRI